MRYVLLSGGSGKRLWPLSNDARSKQFLKVLKGFDGEKVSMVQRVWTQLEEAGMDDKAVIATSHTQVEMLHSQIGSHVSIVTEPERRDTFPAIALAVSYLVSECQASPNEVVAVLPVDPYVEKAFYARIKQLELCMADSEARIGLLGAAPTVPSTKYGYIVPASERSAGKPYVRVARFQEKPSEEEARLLIADGALWNCGVFAFRADYLLNKVRELGFSTSYSLLLEQYSELPKISFDFQVLEHEPDLIALPYEGYWKDLGTWNTLTEEMASTQLGPGVTHDCRNTHVVNELNIPVVVMGISNAVVAASPDGILVADKAKSPRIKDVIPSEQQPMYEEKEWGCFRILDRQSYSDGYGVLTRRLTVFKGHYLSYMMHTERDDIWTVTRGEGQFVMDGEWQHVRPGSNLHIPAKSLHALKAREEIELISVQVGHFGTEDQMVEKIREWQDIVDFVNRTADPGSSKV